jgi:hypothetical protein
MFRFIVARCVFSSKGKAFRLFYKPPLNRVSLTPSLTHVSHNFFGYSSSPILPSPSSLFVVGVMFLGGVCRLLFVLVVLLLNLGFEFVDLVLHPLLGLLLDGL